MLCSLIHRSYQFGIAQKRSGQPCRRKGHDCPILAAASVPEASRLQRVKGAMQESTAVAQTTLELFGQLFEAVNHALQTLFHANGDFVHAGFECVETALEITRVHVAKL